MYDPKVIRRRRAVLALLVASSLILLTAYFGSSSGDGLRSIQRGVGDVIAPVQGITSTALKPARDLVGWVGDTFEAKGENEELRAERDRLREQAVAGINATRENRLLRAQQGLDTNLAISDYEPVSARVIGQSSTLWFQTIKLDKGTDDGLRDNLPVVATDGEGSGLIGRVTDVSGGNAFVTLVTDSSMRIPARLGRGSAGGIVEPLVGNPRVLALEGTRRDDDVRRGDAVVTTGTRDPEYPSFFPSGIPLGEVVGVEEPGTDAQKVLLAPNVDLRSIEFVRVLTEDIEGEG